MTTLTLQPGELTLSQLRQVSVNPCRSLLPMALKPP